MEIQLELNFEINSISESYKENSLYNWCLKNKRQDILDDWNDKDYVIL